jgi:hypothetical protein
MKLTVVYWQFWFPESVFLTVYSTVQVRNSAWWPSRELVSFVFQLNTQHVEQTHPHWPRLVVSHSTCPPLSSHPHTRTAWVKGCLLQNVKGTFIGMSRVSQRHHKRRWNSYQRAMGPKEKPKNHTPSIEQPHRETEIQVWWTQIPS